MHTWQNEIETRESNEGSKGGLFTLAVQTLTPRYSFLSQKERKAQNPVVHVTVVLFHNERKTFLQVLDIHDSQCSHGHS